MNNDLDLANELNQPAQIDADAEMKFDVADQAENKLMELDNGTNNAQQANDTLASGLSSTNEATDKPMHDSN